MVDASLVRIALRAWLLSYVSAALLPSPVRAEEDATPSGRPAPHASHASSVTPGLVQRWVRALDPDAARLRGDHLEVDLPRGHVARLSLLPSLQHRMAEEMRRYRVPAAAFVLLELPSGRVLAHVSHRRDGSTGDVARDPSPPAASVFKVVTSAALLDAGVSPERRVCFGGGARRLTMDDLRDDPQRDRWCVTLSNALGRSLNAVFAKLADRHLKRSSLRRYVSAFGFGQRLPYDVAVPPSPAEVPRDRLERARTAAGFWHVHLSPVHAALLAATVAHRGAMPYASVVDRVLDREGRTVWHAHRGTFRQVIPSWTARRLARMMEHTVREGTARKWFHDPRGVPFLPGLRVAGKTGSLTGRSPYRAYNWFVGLAPVQRPRYAFAALVINGPRWRIKAAHLARRALQWLGAAPGR